ncbi:MAG: 50S ribosomal protein L11 methyltransferase [Acidimicrobiales bacterium]
MIVREDPDGSVPVSQACSGTSTTGVVRVAVPAGGEADLAADALWRAGASAIEERETPTGLLLVAGVAAGADLSPLLEAVDGSWPAEVAAVDVDAALDAWRTFARAVSVGERLRVRPPWVPAGSHRGSVDVVIDPGRAFGSGAHGSTRLALAALDRLVRGGERVLDAGCGSGVLGIAALALGAAEAVGVDHDPVAVAASRANAARNGFADRFTVTGRRLDEVVVTDAPFDLVTANLLLPELLALASALRAALAADGSLVVSGILIDQRPQAIASASRLGLVPVGEETADGWLAVTFAGSSA